MGSVTFAMRREAMMKRFAALLLGLIVPAAANSEPSLGQIYTCPTKLRPPVTLNFGNRTYKVGNVSGPFSETENRSPEMPDEVSTGVFSILSPKLRYNMVV